MDKESNKGVDDEGGSSVIARIKSASLPPFVAALNNPFSSRPPTKKLFNHVKSNFDTNSNHRNKVDSNQSPFAFVSPSPNPSPSIKSSSSINVSYPVNSYPSYKSSHPLNSSPLINTPVTADGNQFNIPAEFNLDDEFDVTDDDLSNMNNAPAAKNVTHSPPAIPNYRPKSAGNPPKMTPFSSMAPSVDRHSNAIMSIQRTPIQQPSFKHSLFPPPLRKPQTPVASPPLLNRSSVPNPPSSSVVSLASKRNADKELNPVDHSLVVDSSHTRQNHQQQLPVSKRRCLESGGNDPTTLLLDVVETIQYQEKKKAHDISLLNASLTHANTEIMMLQETIRALNNEKNSFNMVVERMNAEGQSLDSTIKHIHQRLELLQLTILNLERQANDAIQEKRVLEKDIALKVNELEIMNAKLESMIQLSASEKEKNDVALKSLHEMNEMLKNANSKQHQDLEDKKLDLVKLQTSSDQDARDSVDKLILLTNQHKEESDAFKLEKDALISEKNEMEERLSHQVLHLENDLTKSCITNDLREKEFDLLHHQKVECEKKASECENRAIAASLVSEALASEKEDLTTRIEAVILAIVTQRNENIVVESKSKSCIHSLESQILELQARNAECETKSNCQIVLLESKLSDALRDTQSLQSQISEGIDGLEIMQRQFDDARAVLEKQVVSLCDKNTEMIRISEARDNEHKLQIEELNREKVGLSSTLILELKEKSDLIQKVQEQKSELTINLASMKTKVETYITSQTENMEEIRTLKIEVVGCKDIIRDNQERHDMTTKEINELKKKKSVSDTLMQTDSMGTSEYDDLHKKFKELSENQTSTKQKLQHYYERREVDFTNQVHNLLHDVSALRNENERVNKENIDIKTIQTRKQSVSQLTTCLHSDDEDDTRTYIENTNSSTTPTFKSPALAKRITSETPPIEFKTRSTRRELKENQLLQKTKKERLETASRVIEKQKPAVTSIEKMKSKEKGTRSKKSDVVKSAVPNSSFEDPFEFTEKKPVKTPYESIIKTTTTTRTTHQRFQKPTSRSQTKGKYVRSPEIKGKESHGSEDGLFASQW